jgi:hypothetical protein
MRVRNARYSAGVRVVAAPITLICAGGSTSSAGWERRQIGGSRILIMKTGGYVL